MPLPSSPASERLATAPADPEFDDQSDHCREIFEVTRLADFIAICDSEDGAQRGEHA